MYVNANKPFHTRTYTSITSQSAFLALAQEIVLLHIQTLLCLEHNMIMFTINYVVSFITELALKHLWTIFSLFFDPNRMMESTLAVRAHQWRLTYRLMLRLLSTHGPSDLATLAILCPPQTGVTTISPSCIPIRGLQCDRECSGWWVIG